MAPMSEEQLETGAREGDDGEDGAPLKCDFCGEPAENVRRVALDGEYERLRTRHQPRYACARCSERKEQERLSER